MSDWSLDHGLGDRGIIVTGAARGIGRAVAEAFASAGARVLAVDVDPAVDDVVASLDGTGGRHAAAVCDLTDLDGHRRLISDVVALAGRFDHLAHAAAVLRRRADIDEVTEDDWDFQVGVNLKASFFLMRTAATRPARQRRRRQHHGVHVAGLDDRWLRRIGGLRRDQGWHRVDDTRHGADLRRRRRTRQHRVARRRRHADDARRPDRRGAGHPSSPASRSAASPSRASWPAPSCSSPPTMPATSPARRSTSAAASSCTDRPHLRSPGSRSLVSFGRSRRWRPRSLEH